MIAFRGSRWLPRGILLTLVVILPRHLQSQRHPAPAILGRDTVTIVASDLYAAGGSYRYLLGDNYRDQWAEPIRVPVLDLRGFAGGLKPLKEGGGMQTRSLRFGAADSSEFVFRPVFKAFFGRLPRQYEGTVIWDVYRDQGSASHPSATVVAPPILRALGILHPVPRLVVMPDDPLLGEFRKHFAGTLGTIEAYPQDPDKTGEFGGAVDIIDSEELLKRINQDPDDQVDAHALLTARLADLLLGDNDRHPDQWRWARAKKGAGSRWLPIPRDRDKVFVSYDGLLLDIARRAVPNLVKFGAELPGPTAVFDNAIEFDRRLLAGLDRRAWDSVAASVVRRVGNPVITEAIRAMPREHAALSPDLGNTLRARRDQLPEVARRYYESLWATSDIHATDKDDRATVVRAANGGVTVRIQSGSKAPWFVRHFEPGETSEIRIYLHGGDDWAAVNGNVARSIPVRIVGGNGTNRLTDASIVGGKKNPTRMYDMGAVADVKYAADTAGERASATAALNDYFNRRPWVFAYGELVPPQRDRGASITPIIGARTGHGLGVVPKIGVARFQYGFRRVPYATMLKGELEYSTAIGGFEVGLEGDRRFESSSLHTLAEANMSQIKVGEFRGFGNDTPDSPGEFYDVRQTQWLLRPALGISFAPGTELSIGPIVRFTSTDSTAGRFISEQRPYGFGDFGQAGVQLQMEYDSRDLPISGSSGRSKGLTARALPPVWGKAELVASAYPGFWDAKTAYQEMSAVAMSYLTMPVLSRPVLALRAGGKKVFGEFPYFDAAFIGGSRSLRTEERQRFAGDASLFGTAELRLPIAKFPLILPLDVGILGFIDVARVYLDGESAGGWNTGNGAGFWVGVINPGANLNVLFTNNSERRVLLNLGFVF